MVLVLIVSGFVYFLTLLVVISQPPSFVSHSWMYTIFGLYSMALILVTVSNEYGIICDSAIITFVSSVALYATCEGAGAISYSVKEEFAISSEKSYLYQLQQLQVITTAYSSEILSLIRWCYSPTVWLFFIIRISLVSNFFIQRISQEKEESSSSTVILKATIVYLYAQTVVKRLLGLHMYLAIGRLLQAVGFGILYVISLLCQEDVWE